MVDEHGLTWLLSAPKIELLADKSKRAPYPLNWTEQRRLFAALPNYLTEMALFAVNSGCRDGGVCGLRWEWEVDVPHLGAKVFIIPGARVKNGEDRLVILNRVARSVIEARRGVDATYVFTYDGRRIQRMLTSAWIRNKASHDALFGGRADVATGLCRTRM